MSVRGPVSGRDPVALAGAGDGEGEERLLAVTFAGQLAAQLPISHHQDAVAQAEQLLISQNIGYEVSYISVDYSIQKNSVISQFPDPGDSISSSEKVIVFVGK